MPMMKQLRDSTKIIMVLVAVSFVGLMVFEWGMELSGSTSRGASGSAVGSVNGTDISLEEYQRQYQMLYEQAQQTDADGSLSADELARIEEAAWEEVVNLTLLLDEVKERDIKVTDAEILEFIRNTPPPEILELPAFQTDGQFDLQKYQQALADPALAETWLEYERQLRLRLPINKLQEQIIGGIPVTEAEILERFREMNERARIEYVYLDPIKLVSLEQTRASDEEVRAYYEAHRDEFQRDPSATIRVVTFRPAVTAADSARARGLADSLAGLAREEGSDFAALARRFSDDRSSSERGGDLGWVAPGSMHPAFARGIAGLQAGQVSNPIETPFGWHVVRVEALQDINGESRVNARQIVVATLPSAETREQARDQAQAFARAAGDSPEAFDSAAVEAGLQVVRPPTFERGVVVPGLGAAPAVTEFAFGNPAGSLSGAIEDDGAYHVVRVDARYPAGTVALEEVAGTIRERIVRDKRNAAVRAMSREITQTAVSEGLEGVAQRHGLAVETSPWFTRRNNIPGVGSGTPVAGAAFGLEPGQMAGPIETERGLYLVRLIEKEEIDQSAYQQTRAALRDELRAEKMRETFSAWFQALKANAEIEDNRNEVLGRVSAAG